GVALRRRLTLWQYGAIRTAVVNKAQLAGVALAYVNPAYTSQNCSHCGLRGKRHRHKVTCPSCGHTQHADVNAATNIPTRYVQSRLDGAPSTAPDALPPGEGKLLSFRQWLLTTASSIQRTGSPPIPRRRPTTPCGLSVVHRGGVRLRAGSR